MGAEITDKVQAWIDQSKDANSIHVSMPLPLMEELIAEVVKCRERLNAPVRELKLVKEEGVLAVALGVDKSMQKAEELVNKAVRENRSLAWIIETANQTLGLNDAEWTTFMYTLGWWDHTRRG